MVGWLASGSLTAHTWVRLVTRILALELHTSFVGGAVRVPGALGVAASEGVPQEVGGAGARGSVVDGPTVGILSADPLAACRDASVGLTVTLLRLSTLTV